MEDRRPTRLQRASGESRVAFDLRDGRTRLGDLYQRDPCRVLFPQSEPGEPPQAVLLTTSGGVTDGDSLKMTVEIGPGASAVATTQAAEKIYRAAKGGGHCAIDVAVRVAEGAVLEWLPQETIVFEGARLKRRTLAEVEPGGALLACEMVVLGRAASGETFTKGLLLDSWSVRRTSRLAWTDTLRVEGQTPTGAGFGTANALATVIGVWDEPQPPFEKARALLGYHPQTDVRKGLRDVIAWTRANLDRIEQSMQTFSRAGSPGLAAARVEQTLEIPA